MERILSDFVINRLQEVTDNIRETDAEYALAVKRCKELCYVVNDIAMAKEDVIVNAQRREAFKEFLEYEVTVTTIEQEAIYRQGYLDCVALLQSLGVLHGFGGKHSYV